MKKGGWFSTETVNLLSGVQRIAHPTLSPPLHPTPCPAGTLLFSVVEAHINIHRFYRGEGRGEFSVHLQNPFECSSDTIRSFTNDLLHSRHLQTLNESTYIRRLQGIVQFKTKVEPFLNQRRGQIRNRHDNCFVLIDILPQSFDRIQQRRLNLGWFRFYESINASKELSTARC